MNPVNYCYSFFFSRVVRIRRMREVNQEAVLLAMCTKTFTSKVIIFRFHFITYLLCLHAACDSQFIELLVNSFFIVIPSYLMNLIGKYP